MRAYVGPVLLGYLNLRVDAPRGAVARGQRALARYAAKEGFALGTVFVEQDLNRPLAALAALIEVAQRDDVHVVAVPTSKDLGSLPRVQQLTRQMLEREAGVRVLIVDPAS
jgi:hypothetical protein